MRFQPKGLRVHKLEEKFYAVVKLLCKEIDDGEKKVYNMYTEKKILTERSEIYHCGDDSDEVPPVLIPNTEVKLICADNTLLETAREDRQLLHPKRKHIANAMCFSFAATYLPVISKDMAREEVALTNNYILQTRVQLPMVDMELTTSDIFAFRQMNGSCCCFCYVKRISIRFICLIFLVVKGKMCV